MSDQKAEDRTPQPGRILRVVISFVFLLVFTPCLFAQPESAIFSALIGEKVTIRTDNSRIVGKVVSVSADSVSLEDDDGFTVIIHLRNITGYRETSAVDYSEQESRSDAVLAADLLRDPVGNRLFVIPTGFPMRVGEFHGSLLPGIADASVGISRNLSAWIGASLAGPLLSVRGHLIATDNLGLSVGALGLTTWSLSDYLLLPYVIASFGSPRESLTIGVAVSALGVSVIEETRTVIGLEDPDEAGWREPDWDYTLRDLSYEAQQLVMVLGGKLSISRNIGLMSENWFGIDLVSLPNFIDGSKDFASVPMGVFSGNGIRLVQQPRKANNWFEISLSVDRIRVWDFGLYLFATEGVVPKASYVTSYDDWSDLEVGDYERNTYSTDPNGLFFLSTLLGDVGILPFVSFTVIL